LVVRLAIAYDPAELDLARRLEGKCPNRGGDAGCAQDQPPEASALPGIGSSVGDVAVDDVVATVHTALGVFVDFSTTGRTRDGFDPIVIEGIVLIGIVLIGVLVVTVFVVVIVVMQLIANVINHFDTTRRFRIAPPPE
jgi:hypothetical protein